MSSGTLLSSPEVETRGTRTREFGPVNTRAHVKLGSGRRREEIPVQDTAQLSLPLPASPCLSVRMTERSGVCTCPVSRIHDTSRLLPPISKTAHDVSVSVDITEQTAAKEKVEVKVEKLVNSKWNYTGQLHSCALCTCVQFKYIPPVVTPPPQKTHYMYRPLHYDNIHRPLH